MIGYNMPFSMKSSPQRNEVDLFSQPSYSPIKEFAFEEPTKLKRFAGKSRAMTHHSTRFSTKNKKIESREKGLHNGFSKDQLNKRRRLMTGNPSNRPNSEDS